MMILKTNFYSLCIVVVVVYNNYDVSGTPVANDNLKLELVQVLFRHGERTPIPCEALYHPSSNESLYEPWGYNQLTNTGMMQEYEIGQMLRTRYSHYLPDLYKPRDIYAYTSEYDRTKASLQLVLAALYPPVESLTWNKNLKWMPIAIHFNPLPMDVLMKPRNCPKFVETVRELYNSSEIRARLDGYKDVLKALLEIRGDFRIDEVNCAYNIIHVHKHLNLSLPSWYNDALYSRIVNLTEFFLDTLAYNTALKRLNGGPLVRRFVENLDNPHGKKMYLYSAHEKNLHAFDRAHDLNVLRIPDHGSAIIVEKLRDERGQVFVKLLLWSGVPKKKLMAMKLKNCPESCPLDEYLRIVEPILPSDDDMRCLYKNLDVEDIEKILVSDITRG